MLHIRKENPALIWGEYQPLYEESTDFLAFLRIAPEQKCLVTLNMSEKAQSVQLIPGLHPTRVIFSSHAKRLEVGKIQLAPFEVFIAEAV
jgi:hypothetical protein